MIIIFILIKRKTPKKKGKLRRSHNNTFKAMIVPMVSNRKNHLVLKNLNLIVDKYRNFLYNTSWEIKFNFILSVVITTVHWKLNKLVILKFWLPRGCIH